MPNINEELVRISQYLNTHNVTSPRLEAELIIAHALKITREQLLARLRQELHSQTTGVINTMVNHRLSGLPIAYIRGFTEFYGRKFTVDKRVLVPRPETEDIVDLAIKHAPENAKVLDLGTGSGVIAITLKFERPDLQVTASDISSDALEVAQKNVAKYHINDISFKRSDLMDDINESFDVIIANLPYVPTGMTDPSIAHEPDLALFAGSDGLDAYKRLFAQITNEACPQMLITESLPFQHDQIAQLANTLGMVALSNQNLAQLFIQA